MLKNKKIYISLSLIAVSVYLLLADKKLLAQHTLTSRLKGRILLAVEEHGEAWYVSPVDFKRYFLGRPVDAYNIMRSLGLGIANNDIAKILARTPDYIQQPMEKQIHDLINNERISKKLGLLGWNDELAAVAREHSENLVRENKQFVNVELSCDFPIIHHEGLDFGMYNNDRLAGREIYYYGKSGENIALIPAAEITALFRDNDPVQQKLQSCNSQREIMDDHFKETLDSENDNNKKVP